MAGLNDIAFRGALNPRTRTPEEIEAEQAANAAATYGDFGGGLASATRGMVGSTKAYAGAALDAMGAENAAGGLRAGALEDTRRAQVVAPEVATTDQITDASTLGRYVAGKAGGAAGSMPLGLAGGVGGRLLTKSGAGALAGSTLAYQPVMAGGHVQEIEANPNLDNMGAGEKFARATGLGTAQAALEGAGTAWMSNRLLSRRAPATSLSGALRGAGADTLKGAALEGVGAAGSDALGQAGIMQADPTAAYDPRQTFEAGVGEAVGGAGVSAPTAAAASTLDYLDAGKDLAVDGAKKAAETDLGNPMSGALDKAKGAAQNVADAGALFKNTASGYLKHPELARLVAAQEMPPELEGASTGEIESWLAQDDGQRHQAALQIAQRTVIDREASESKKAVAQALLDNPTDPKSWKPFADGVIAERQIERLGAKAGQLRSKMSGWVDKARGKTKSNLESTEHDAAYFGAMRPTLVRATGVKDGQVLDDTADAVRQFLLSDATRDEAGWERMPSELVEAFGDSTTEVLAKAYDALRRQGLTRDIKTKQEITFYTPEVAQRTVDKKLKVRNAAADVVHNNLALGALPQMPARDSQDFLDISDGIRDYLQRARSDAQVEQYLDTLFGPNKDAALEEIAGLDKPVQSSLGKGPVDAALIDRGENTDAALTETDGETGSDAAIDGAFENDNGMTELNTDEDTRYLFKGQKSEAFDTEDAFLDTNLDLARKSLAPQGRALKYDRVSKEDKLQLDRVGVMDYASETGDRRLLDELLTKHPDLTHEEINQRFFVAKNEASEMDQGEAIDARPEDLQIGAGKKGSWQARTRVDSKSGNKDVSTLEHGRLYIDNGEFKTPFVTSSRVLIERMWDAKKRGAFDEGTADKVGAADKLAMFSAGLSSLLSAMEGKSIKISIKTPDGEMYQVDGADDLPDTFALWASNDPAARLTLGDVKGRTNKAFRAKKQKQLKGQEPGTKRWTDTVTVADIPGMTRTELGEATLDLYEAMMMAPTKAILETLKKKHEVFKTAHDKRVTERAPGEKKEQALKPAAKLAGTQATVIDLDNAGDPFTEGTARDHAGANDRVVKRGDRWVIERAIGHKVERKPEHLTETEEMSAAVQESERRFDEETGLELHPRGATPKGRALVLERQVTALRAEYKVLADKIKEYEGKEGKNAVREGNLRKWRADLAAVVEKGKTLAAKREELAANERALDKKSAAFQQKQKVQNRIAEARAKAEPGFLRDAQGESTGAPATDARAVKDIAYLEATIAAHHGEGTADGVYEAVTLPDHAALNQIAQAFGARVRGFRVVGDKAKYGFFSGVYQGGNRDVIYLSDAAKRPHMALLGHELVHQMKKTNPALYAKFESLVSKHIKPDAYKAWSKMFPETGDKLREEFMAEVVSDGVMDRTFWEAVAKKDMNVARQVYASVMRLFKQIMATVGYTPKTKSVLDDYNAVMKIAGEVMAEHGVKPDMAKFNMESLEQPGAKKMTAEQKAEIESYIESTLGPQVTTIVTDQLKGSGEWSRDAKNQKATIRIATSALNPLSVAHHEAMHEFFQRLLDGKYERAANVLRNAADSPLIKRQLERHFATQPEVLKQIESDVEERVAYMFQLWAADKLDIGTQTETVFRKIINVIRKTLGLVSQEKQLEEILQAFHAGEMAEASAMAEVLDSQEARTKYLKKIGAKANPALKKANEWVGFAENALTGQKNPHLDEIGRLLNNKTGSRGDAQGFLSAKEQANNLYMNKFATALKGLDPAGKDTRTATKADVDLALEGLQAKTWHADPVVLRIQQQVDDVFREMMQYMKDRGVKVLNTKTGQWDDVREIKDYRIPVAWDPAKIIEESGQFKELLLEHHEAELTRIAKEANDEVAKGTGAGKYTASLEKLQNKDTTPVTAEDVANAIVARLINSNGQAALKEDASSLGFSPFAKSVNERTLDWIDQTVFAEFQEKDIVKIISSYVGQVTKRGEYSARFGADGGKLQEKMDAAWQFEIDQIKAENPDISDVDAQAEAAQNLEPARRAIMAMEGTLGHDISAFARKASAYTIVYQNVRLLGYALFSNVIDPLGMMVRGAEFKDAYAAFKRGMRDVGREWGDLTGLREKKATDDDEAVRVAEMIGTVDSAGFMSQMGTIYGSQYLPSWAKNVNDTFFRWNGLEAFNRAMRVQATQAAISFIKRHHEKPNDHSDRYFEELGLSRDDVQVNEKGELNVENHKVQQAVMRWVDGAILRPNAAIRPTMSSDPHYAVFYHLKQFMYAMHAVILKRVQVEIKNGNTDPLIMLLAGYVPVMLAADAAKGLIQEATGGGAPYWQRGSVGDVLAHGVQRAGLLGVGQIGVDVGGHGVVDAFGPAVGQAADLITQPLGESVSEAVAVGPLSMLTKGVEEAESVKGEAA